MTEHRTAAQDARGYLVTYLRDHRGGAAAGVRLARRARDQAHDDELGAMLTVLAAEIAADRAVLDSLMADLAISPSRAKELLASGAELLGRLKSNRHLWWRSPLSDLLELEALGAGIRAKRDLWESLTATADRYPMLDRELLKQLIGGATDQLDRVSHQHRRVAELVL